MAEQFDSVGGENITGMTFGDYRILSRLDGGAQGEIFRAEQISLRREVALKALVGSHLAGKSARSRFLREGALIAKLSHPYIVPIYQAGDCDGLLYYTMELIQGNPLDDYVRDKALNSQQMLQLMIKVCEGMEAAHRHGVVHRDLKPGNILVDQRGDPRILDFGLGKMVAESVEEFSKITQSGWIMGTPAFMSPEQALAKPSLIDARTDVYSLGVILYYLSTGEFPYDTSGPVPQILERICAAPPVPPRTRVPGIPRDLETIILKTLRKEKEARYASAGELGDELKRFQAGKPIVARRPTIGYRLQKLVTRNKAMCGMVAALVLALLIAGVAMLALARRTDADRRTAAGSMGAEGTNTAAADASAGAGDSGTGVASAGNVELVPERPTKPKPTVPQEDRPWQNLFFPGEADDDGGAPVAKITLTCSRPFNLYVNTDTNAKPVAEGPSATNKTIEVPLIERGHVFALELTGGTAAVRLQAPGMTTAPTSWRMCPAGQAGALEPDTDDRDWPSAPVVGQTPDGQTIVGKPLTPTILRHTLLWKQTRVWPTPSPALHIARRSAQRIRFVIPKLARRQFKDWTLYLAVPPEFEVLGSTGFCVPAWDEQHFQSAQLGLQRVDGQRMRVAKITALELAPAAYSYPLYSECEAFLRYREDAPEPGLAETRFFYWIEGNDGAMSEPHQAIPVRVLPALNGRQPKLLTWQISSTTFSHTNSAEMREHSLQTMQRAGLNHVTARAEWLTELGPKYGMHSTRSALFVDWALNLKPYLTDHPKYALLGFDSTLGTKRGLMCTTATLGNGWPAVSAQLKAMTEPIPPDALNYTSEFSVFTGPHSCYCEQCLAAFKQHAGLPAHGRLSPKLIKEKWSEKWTDFVCWRTARIFRKMKDSIHELSPRTLFQIESGHYYAPTRTALGVCWDYIQQHNACDLALCSYASTVDMKRRMLNGLAPIPVASGVRIPPFFTDDLTPVKPATTAAVLRAALDSNGGLVVYSGRSMEGRSWLALAETSRLVAEHEKLFIDGQRLPYRKHDEETVQLLSKDNAALLCVLNNTDKPSSTALTMPWKSKEFYSGQLVAAGENVTCKLPPGKASAYVRLP